MRSKRNIIQVVLAVILAVTLAGCTGNMKGAQTKVLHDKSIEGVEETKVAAPETNTAEPDTKAAAPNAKAAESGTKKTATKEESTKPVKQKDTEQKQAIKKKQTADQRQIEQPTTKPAHTHSWQAVYATKTVTDYKQVCLTRCSTCGADITGHASEHRKQEAMAGNNAGSYETYETVACGSHTEQYITGYKCSCGATK